MTFRGCQGPFPASSFTPHWPLALSLPIAFPSSTTPNGTSKQGSAQDKDKPRLTDQEKKSNHIASEQKRRAAIREGFDRLTELVPGLEGQGRSESIVLQKTVDFIHVKLQERHDLIAEIESKGGRVDDSFRPT
ncbi:unnamed protein product [Penicillium discolor]